MKATIHESVHFTVVLEQEKQHLTDTSQLLPFDWHTILVYCVMAVRP